MTQEDCDHFCDNCGGIDPGSCWSNPDRQEADNETATVLARYIGSQRLGDLQAAFRLLGMKLDLEVKE